MIEGEDLKQCREYAIVNRKGEKNDEMKPIELSQIPHNSVEGSEM